jgi:hypothetical protein
LFFKFILSCQQFDNCVPLFATGVVATGGKFAAGIFDTGGKFLPPVPTTLAKLVEKICRRCR